MDNDVVDTVQDSMPMPDACLEVLSQLSEVITAGHEVRIIVTNEQVIVERLMGVDVVEDEVVEAGSELLEALNYHLEFFEQLDGLEATHE